MLVMLALKAGWSAAMLMMPEEGRLDATESLGFQSR